MQPSSTENAGGNEVITNFVGKMKSIFNQHYTRSQNNLIVPDSSITSEYFVTEMSKHVAKEVLARTKYPLTEDDVYNYMHEHLQKYKGDLDLAFKNGFDENAYTAWGKVILDEVQAGLDAYDRERHTANQISKLRSKLFEQIEDWQYEGREVTWMDSLIGDFSMFLDGKNTLNNIASSICSLTSGCNKNIDWSMGDNNNFRADIEKDLNSQNYLEAIKKFNKDNLGRYERRLF